MTELKINHDSLRSDCKNCFGLCCVALPFAKSADFAFDKKTGTPCPNLGADFRCGIHNNLRKNGFHGCVGYECFGAGQKVSLITYQGKNWREHPELANEMFQVFPIMQQLHEMLSYIDEAVRLKEAEPLINELQLTQEKTKRLTVLSPKELLELDVADHREFVNDVLVKMSELIRAKINRDSSNRKKAGAKRDYIGANLKGADLRGSNFRGALLIAADLRNANLRFSDFIGADFRDTDLRGADLRNSIFLTQAQINSAKGDVYTKLPSALHIPDHWKDKNL